MLDRMNPESEKNEKLAGRIIDQAIRQITSRFPEFIYALDHFKRKTTTREIKLSTDGKAFIYNPNRLVRQFTNQGIEEIEIQILHTLMHYLRGDIFAYRESAHKSILNVCMDMEVHRALAGLGVVKALEDPEARADIGYYGYKYDRRRAAKLKPLADKLVSDEHGYWAKLAGIAQNGIDQNEEDGASDIDVWLTITELTFDTDGIRLECMQDGFDKLMEQLASRGGDGASQDICIGFQRDYLASKTKSDYKEMMRDLLQDTIREKETEETPDRAMYCYGLDMYGDVALIEPGEDEDISYDLGRLAIAIDTSGSCFFDTVDGFLGYTGRLIEEVAPNLTEDSEIIIFECDDQIRVEDRLRGDQIRPGAFARRMLHGGGGTSFVPVIERVSKLSEAESERPIRALIYLSDAYGIFPDKAPDYPVIFVMPHREDADEEPDIPAYVSTYYYDKEDGQGGDRI
ncbi:MAG: VWA-like domain-containing protein [Lachnospiraceae bacterium]|nr:VWA-like domain-containing protein [Lachnospiraceae bacterium]